MLGVIAIFGIISVQAYWVTSTWNINDREFDEKVNTILYETVKAIAEINNAEPPKKDIIKRKTSNYYLVNVDSEISPNMLETTLQEQIEMQALNIDFEYGIYDCSSNEMVYGNYCEYELKNSEALTEGSDLPVLVSNASNYYFGIRFPTRPSYLFSKMQLSIFFSTILLLTIIFFAYSMFTILRQNRLSKMQKEFINNMTHEFKTPLSTIKIAADVFLKNPAVQEDKRLHTYANIIKQQNQRLNDQVERVLNIAKFEKNNFALKKEPVNLNEILEKIKENVAVQVKEKDGQLWLNLPATAQIIEADRFHLSNILYNLLDNSIKYCKKAPQIEIDLYQQNKALCISIRDNGIGIAKEHQPQVFEKFYRIPTGNVHDVKGFGIGLYYVKKICEEHQWTIKLKSKLDQYTQFIITIPN